MSQEYSKAGKAKESDSERDPPSQPFRPQYMTVGSGSTSASATALMAALENDSGYGGSIAGDSWTNSGSLRTLDASETHDVPTPLRNLNTDSPADEQERRTMASHIHQLLYNQNRVSLGRAINKTVEVLRDLQQMNTEWPAHYPSTQSQQQEPPRPTSSSRPELRHSATTLGDGHDSGEQPTARPQALRRAETSVGEDHTAESSSAAGERADRAPEGLITIQAAQDFSILKLDLNLQGLSQSEIAHSIDRRAMASLLDGRINQSLRHLQSLRDRIEDTASKVLVTGDLNAGKSTFCNALLRRKVLPEDQQPCTSIFCEVLDARENGGIEEVHAIHRNAVYNRNDESTYDVYSLKDLEKLVVDNDTYNQCKVYVKDIRTIDESLLNNGVVDISIIDAPGLNSDSLKTTAVFARQEEIDVVVFVVSAANHFTLSAKEFLRSAAQEKAYLFIVVNGFDNIRDQQRCQRLVLDQVAGISPQTFKESSELVHFVSSSGIPVAPSGAPPGGPPGGGGSGGSGSSSGPSVDPKDNEDGDKLGKHGDSGAPPGKDKGKAKENQENFDQLEQSLRRFVLEKRARSKLAPARTYLLNVLTDLNYLGTTNRDIAQSELERVSKELAELEPAFENSKKARSEVSDNIERTIDTTCDTIYKHTRESLTTTISRVADADLGVEYTGLLGVFDFAEDIKTAILDQITASVAECEENARQSAVNGVETIKELGLKHLGDEFKDLKFRSDMMFRRKKDALARQVNTPIEFWDFVDLTSLWERQEKVAGTGMAMTAVTVLGGRMVGGVGWMDGALGAAKIMGSNGMRKMIVPGLILTVALTAAYVVNSIPTSLPHRLSRRIASDLAAIDYTHINSTRISAEVGKVLRYPADNLRVGLQHSVEKLSAKRDETAKTKKESEVAKKYFTNLVRESSEGHRSVEAVDLESPAPGIAGSYESGPTV